MNSLQYQHGHAPNVPSTDFLNSLKGNLRISANGIVVHKREDMAAVAQQLQQIMSKARLYEFMIHDLAGALYFNRLHRFQSLSLHYEQLECVSSEDGSPYTGYKVKLVGRTCPGGPDIKAGYSFARIALEDAMLRMALHYQDQLGKYDILAMQPWKQPFLEIRKRLFDEIIVLFPKNNGGEINAAVEGPVVGTPVEAPIITTPVKVPVVNIPVEVPVVGSDAGDAETTLKLGDPVPASFMFTSSALYKSPAVQLFINLSISDPRLESPEDKSMQKDFINAAYEANAPKGKQPQDVNDDIPPQMDHEENFEEAWNMFINWEDA
ncbi:hypothetical protein SLS60_007313 [Paraconiothyrium brasiliense]|uniref:Uncharacterized protein n=1 Tax=Paraconiothyrium brasiliense TaxID=300254 RepID=A0ABR3R4Z0_9PLEO